MIIECTHYDSTWRCKACLKEEAEALAKLADKALELGMDEDCVNYWDNYYEL